MSSTEDKISQAAQLLLSAHAQLLEDPKASQMVLAREEVLGRYGPMFRDPARLGTLTSSELRDFLKFDNNKHWTLHRAGTKLTADMAAVRRALKQLTNEALPLAERFDAACEHEGMGRALASAILLVAYPERYSVWNTTSEGALELLGVMPLFARGSTLGQRYAKVNATILGLVAATGLSTWDLDAALWLYLSRSEGGVVGDDVTSAGVDSVPEKERQRVWGIYVSKSAAGNFGTGLAASTWGGAKQENFSDVREGDGVFFVHQITSDEPAPRGFPRVPTANFRG